jgi:hypothetical protein
MFVDHLFTRRIIMTYKLAFVSMTGQASRLWMCDAKRGARSVILSSYDGAVSALLGEGWEPFGIAADGALWFRKAEVSAADGWLSPDGESAHDMLAEGMSAVEPVEALAGFAPA